MKDQDVDSNSNEDIYDDKNNDEKPDIIDAKINKVIKNRSTIQYEASHMNMSDIDSGGVRELLCYSRSEQGCAQHHARGGEGQQVMPTGDYYEDRQCP